MRQKIIFNIVIASILAAMALVLEKLGIKIPLLGNTTTLRISFYGLPLMIAGIIFGYKTGLLSGLIMAIISQLVLSEYGIFDINFIENISSLGAEIPDSKILLKN